MGANIYKNKKPLTVFLLPAFLFIIVYLYYPFFMNVINSFQKIKTLGQMQAQWNDPGIPIMWNCFTIRWWGYLSGIR